MTRFAPFYANSGFFFLQRTVSTRWFWDHVVMESGMVAVFRSQQAMTTWLLNTHHTRLGMTVLMLPYDKYVSGAFLNGKISRFPTVETSDAVVLHFCWTNSKIEKAALMVVRDSAFIPLKHIVGGVPEAHWNEHPWEEICLAGGSLGAHLFNNSYEDALAAAQQADREVKAEVNMKQEETYRKQKSHASRFAKHSKKRL